MPSFITISVSQELNERCERLLRDVFNECLDVDLLLVCDRLKKLGIVKQVNICEEMPWLIPNVLVTCKRTCVNVALCPLFFCLRMILGG